MLRSILAVVLGIIVGGITVGVVEFTGHTIYPPPPDLDASNREALSAYIATAPIAVLLFVMAAWVLGAFTGGLVAAWIGRRAPVVHALIIGGFILLSGIASMLYYPHPAWFWVVGIVTVPSAAYAAARLVGPSRTV
ncbi:MAG: hypothetical protein JNM56_14625 [Planctomycetia bacterium]|nr:hypothetical protein [Planctomycetia bacterium]